MNSVLQCLASCVPMTNFFLSKQFERDIINKSIPKAFYDVMKAICSSPCPVNPKNLKSEIEKSYPQVSYPFFTLFFLTNH